MDGKFKRRTRFVAGRYTTDQYASLNYSIVVYRDSVWIALTIYAINYLDIWSCDIGNIYLNEKYRDKIWAKFGAEFGNDKGKFMIIMRALYGLKSSGKACRAMLDKMLLELGYTPSRSDIDVWMNHYTNPETGKEYYAYLLLYVGDLIHLHHDP